MFVSSQNIFCKRWKKSEIFKIWYKYIYGIYLHLKIFKKQNNLNKRHGVLSVNYLVYTYHDVIIGVGMRI